MALSFASGFYPPSNSTVSVYVSHCFHSTVGQILLTAISCAYTLLVLPLSAFVLHLGFQRWGRRSSAPSAGNMTHSDFLTYNMAVTELLAACSCTFYYCSSYAELPALLSFGIALMFFTWPGQNLFPVLTCVEQYLAVVHPITYRGLKNKGGVMIRKISTGCIWSTCLLWMCVVVLLNPPSYYRYSTVTLTLTLSLIIMVFCSLSVLRVLIRPPPGKAGCSRAQVGQLRHRLVRTILITMGVLWLKFGGNVVVSLMRFSALVSVKCVVEVVSFVLYLPSSVVLPMMFLHRAGKLPKCQQRSGSA